MYAVHACHFSGNHLYLQKAAAAAAASPTSVAAAAASQSSSVAAASASAVTPGLFPLVQQPEKIKGRSTIRNDS
jgi:hypothetical protein